MRCCRHSSHDSGPRARGCSGIVRQGLPTHRCGHNRRVTDTPDVSPGEDAHSLVSRFALTRIDRDIFSGYCHAGSPLRAFGGQVAAQALVAASHTLDPVERRVHSLSGYFLRAGRTTDPIIYLVDSPRDGRTFSTRLVRAVQFGETIFTMSASFAASEPGPRHSRPMPAAPAPETLPLANLPVVAGDERLRELGYPGESLIEVRLVSDKTVAELSEGKAQRMAWFRARDPLPDNPTVHVCALTYFSDVTLPRTTVATLPPSQRINLELTSIDHAMWFHSRVSADRWVLFVQDSHAAGHGHALARGEFFQDGVMVGTAVQEVLQRVRRR